MLQTRATFLPISPLTLKPHTPLNPLKPLQILRELVLVGYGREEDLRLLRQVRESAGSIAASTAQQAVLECGFREEYRCVAACSIVMIRLQCAAEICLLHPSSTKQTPHDVEGACRS